MFLDVCPEGHGVWLDHQELEKVQVFMEHWNHEAVQKKAAWVKLARDAERVAVDRTKAFDAKVHRALGPIGDLAFFVARLLK